MNRRTFLFTSSGASADSLLVPGLAAGAGEGHKSPYGGSGLVTGKLKTLRHKEIPGFLSAAQVTPHYTAHYGGALKAFAGVEEKLEESFSRGTPIDAAAFQTMKQVQVSARHQGVKPVRAAARAGRPARMTGEEILRLTIHVTNDYHSRHAEPLYMVMPQVKAR